MRRWLAGFRHAKHRAGLGKRFDAFTRARCAAVSRVRGRAPVDVPVPDGACLLAGRLLVDSPSLRSASAPRTDPEADPYAEDVYAALVVAAQAYFRALPSDVTLQDAFIARTHATGGRK